MQTKRKGKIENPESNAEKMAAAEFSTNADIVKGLEEIKDLIANLFTRLDEVEETIYKTN